MQIHQLERHYGFSKSGTRRYRNRRTIWSLTPQDSQLSYRYPHKLINSGQAVVVASSHSHPYVQVFKTNEAPKHIENLEKPSLSIVSFWEQNSWKPGSRYSCWAILHSSSSCYWGDSSEEYWGILHATEWMCPNSTALVSCRLQVGIKSRRLFLNTFLTQPACQVVRSQSITLLVIQRPSFKVQIILPLLTWMSFWEVVWDCEINSLSTKLNTFHSHCKTFWLWQNRLEGIAAAI